MKKTWIIGIAAAILLCAVVGLFFSQNQNGQDNFEPEPVSSVAVSSAPTWQEQYDLGIRYLSEGNYQEAILAFNAAIEIDPKRPEAYVGRGNARIFSGETQDNLAAALADYEAAINADPTNVEAWLGLADVYIRMGDYEKALEVLKEALEKTGGDQMIADKIAEIESGNISDSQGRTRRETGYNEDGSLNYYIEWTYLDGKSTVASYDAEGAQTGYAEYESDENGNAIKGCTITTGGETGHLYWKHVKQSIYENDSKGQHVKSSTYNYDGSLDSYSEYDYDASGNRIESRAYHADGSMFNRFVYEYDQGRKLTKHTLYQFRDGEMTSYQVISYDEKGNGVENTHYDVDGTPTSYTYFEYDDAGNRIQLRSYDPDGNLTWRVIYEYDESGKKVRETEYNGDGSVRYVYSFE